MSQFGVLETPGTTITGVSSADDIKPSVSTTYTLTHDLTIPAEDDVFFTVTKVDVNVAGDCTLADISSYVASVYKVWNDGDAEPATSTSIRGIDDGHLYETVSTDTTNNVHHALTETRSTPFKGKTNTAIRVKVYVKVGKITNFSAMCAQGPVITGYKTSSLIIPMEGQFRGSF